MHHVYIFFRYLREKGVETTDEKEEWVPDNNVVRGIKITILLHRLREIDGKNGAPPASDDPGKPIRMKRYVNKKDK